MKKKAQQVFFLMLDKLSTTWNSEQAKNERNGLNT